MVSIRAEKDEIHVSIPTRGLSPAGVASLLDWLRVEVLARRSRLTPAGARRLAGEVKSGWWADNRHRFG